GFDDRSRGPFTPDVTASTAAVTDARPAAVYAASASRTRDERLILRVRACSVSAPSSAKYNRRIFASRSLSDDSDSSIASVSAFSKLTHLEPFVATADMAAG